jgi:hypothetical protein
MRTLMAAAGLTVLGGAALTFGLFEPRRPTIFFVGVAIEVAVGVALLVLAARASRG